MKLFISKAFVRNKVRLSKIHNLKFLLLSSHTKCVFSYTLRKAKSFVHISKRLYWKQYHTLLHFKALQVIYPAPLNTQCARQGVTPRKTACYSVLTSAETFLLYTPFQSGQLLERTQRPWGVFVRPKFSEHKHLKLYPDLPQHCYEHKSSANNCKYPFISIFYKYFA